MRVPSEQAIRERAYHLWDGDGRPDGRSIDYWLQAARELEEEAARSATAAVQPAALKAKAGREIPKRKPRMNAKSRTRPVEAPNGARAPETAKGAAVLPEAVRNAP